MEKRKQITFDVPEKLHKEVKIRCVVRNVSIREYVIQAIAEKIAKEKQYEDRMES